MLAVFLRGAHGQLRSVLNAATQVAIIATDLRGVINTFNAGAEQMLGFPAEQVVGRLTLESLHLAVELEARSASLSVTLGKRIGSRLFVSYEQGVRGVWNLLRIQYTLTRRLSVRAQSGSDTALDLLYSFSFD